MMALNLQLLRVFVTVVEQGSFSAAAKALYISQPAVSKRIREFELQVGAVLINRSRRHIDLTEAGQILFHHGQQLFAIERTAEQQLSELYRLDRGKLAIGASHTTGTYLLPPLLRRFHQRYPNTLLSLDINNTRNVIDHLRTIPLDLAFIEGVVDEPDIQVRHWRTDRLVVIAAPQHPLARKSQIPFEEIAQYDFIQREQGSGTGEIIESAFQDRGLPMRMAFKLGSNEVVIRAVIAGLGISIVSEATIELEVAAGALVVVDCADFQLHRSLWLASVKNRALSHAAQAFLDLIANESNDRSTSR